MFLGLLLHAQHALALNKIPNKNYKELQVIIKEMSSTIFKGTERRVDEQHVQF